ncbi:hypothetical protein Salat_0487300 [Sesamum alatum]|uniref:Uncharacterized protein n=1 Tax=Sesamum alatum TaxID=300844 RepID=A0AAE1Z3H8_9LAMI|nr:hypothetical protein Salat_0487300 [Sesamum alatum]
MLHWLSKKPHEHPKKVAKDGNVHKSNNSCNSVGGDTRRRRLKGVQECKLSCEDVCLLRFLQRRDLSRAFFYRTLNLKGMRIKRDNEIHGGLCLSDKAADSAGAASPEGCKVLPVTDSNSSSSSSGNGKDQRPTELGKNGKKKGICRVKELLRWGAAAKGEKNSVARKVLHFKNTTGLKEVVVEDQFIDDSPKISFGAWNVERCSTTNCSAYSAISKSSTVQIDISRSISLHVQSDQYAGRIENWITTDSEFVVLELCSIREYLAE